MLRVSKEHGVNPGVELCFFCNEPKGLLLWGELRPEMREALRKSGLTDGGTEAPRNAVINQEPCGKCQDLMRQGVILISAREPLEKEHREHTCQHCHHSWRAPIQASAHTGNLSGEATPFCPSCGHGAVSSGPILPPDDPQNPYRTGGWVVVTDNFIRQAISSEEIRERVLKKRAAFLPDEVWSLLELPRGEPKEAESAEER